ncbi:cadherin-23-like [Trichomycterus rosablanca]|uniref:cadherin-23-like n=1 Tax=Trichomycterus rosablanca TaxID=2290929 RepID=UPI002F35CC87
MTSMQLKWQIVFIICTYGMGIVFCQARYSIQEETTEGSLLGNIAKDLGIEINRLIVGKARVVTKGDRQYVELNRDKGALVVKERIDREDLCQHTTPCSFSFDLIMENPIELHRIIVEVLDINDNAPVFGKEVVNLEISENTASGTRFPLDSAIDMDIGINGIQNYALSPTDHFKIETKSQDDESKYIEMILDQELDREERDELKLVLIAFDGGSPKKSGTMKIHISVLDANDNAPVCQRSEYKVQTLENAAVGTIITKVSANDADEKNNGQILYTIAQASKLARELFKINTHTGEITTLNTLDYETVKNFHLSVKARDKGGLADTCKVVIEVNDVNDNSPSIQLMSFSNIIAENSPLGTTVAVIDVDDADSGQNGLVQCKINEKLPFKLKSSPGDYYALITDDFLDRENDAEYNVTIMVSDQGSPSRHSTKTLNVKISDVNDNPPVFSVDEYKAFISENNSPGIAVFTVKASDADLGPNARLSYLLKDNNQYGIAVSSIVSINLESGIIHATRTFDFEQIKSFSFNVTAQDGGSPPLSSEVTVTIIIQDQNDNAPQVLYPVQTSGSPVAEIVPRSADVGYLVTKVVAVDVDSGQNAWLSYKLQKPTDRALFEVGPQNGEIRTVRQVTDKDAVNQKLTVVVEDNGQPSRSAVVNINVAVADSFSEVIAEFSDITHGKGNNGDLTFYLVLLLAAVSFLFITTVVVIISVKIYRWRQSRVFHRSNLPVIPYYPPGYADTGTLSRMYNYDVCMTAPSGKSDCKYSTLSGQSVLVVEPCFTDTFQRTVNEKEMLEDDESPELVSTFFDTEEPEKMLRLVIFNLSKGTFGTVFSYTALLVVIFCSHYVCGQISYSIPEEMAKGSIIGNIVQDLGLDLKRLKLGNARMYTGASKEYVELNRENGLLLIKDKIDRESLCARTTPCALHLQMILQNPMELYSVTLEVTDINDNEPVFQKNEIRIEVSESAITGARFVLGKAVDSDVGINGLQTYSLIPTDNFILDKESVGEKNVEMILQKQLDRERQDNIDLVLTALDGGEPQLSSSMHIYVSVLDVNDNPPVFAQKVYKATIIENATKGTKLTTVTASDADTGFNSNVSYYISDTMDSGVADIFFINKHNGDVLLNNKIDYETLNHYQLDIQARDQGGLSDTCKVVIDVLDINDNTPRIDIISMSSSISEISNLNTVVAMLKINDPDSGANGQVDCNIIDNIPFEIISQSNNFFSIRTNQELDREKDFEYNITVTCFDEGVPSLSSSASLRLHISDVNDNAPVFERNNYESYVVENNTPGLSILKLKASDTDSNQNARVSYILEDSTVNGVPVSSYVSVSADSGVINAVRSFDYEQLKDFNFCVKAQDGGSPSLTSNVTVRFIIQDQNDNAPQVLYPVQTSGSPVAEIVPPSADVGYLVAKVVAVDVDSGQNAWLSYKLQKASDRALFEVGQQNGEIRTVRQVTDKDAVKQKLTVVVEDNGQPSRSAVVNINVVVADRFPVALSEFKDFTQGKQYNNDLTFYLVLALAAVSFLFITTVVVIISVKIYRWRQSRIFYQSNLPVIPYYPPGYTDTGVTGTLPHIYNYDVCMTTDSKKSYCKYSTLNGQSVLVEDPSFTETHRTVKENLLHDHEFPEMVRVSYSIPEEIPKGSVVGNITQDLGLDLKRLKSGKARVFSGDSTEYIDLNKEKGTLLIKEKIDRESLCAKTTPCALHLQMILESPMELFTITAEITDINDNSPFFESDNISLKVSEAAMTGARFTLEKAMDADVGTNALQSYSLKPTDHFVLEMQIGFLDGDGNKHLEMVLKRPLDREKQEQFTLLLTAIDGGEPMLTGTVQIHVTVLDANDNAPIFTQKIYKSSVTENSPKGTKLTTVSAFDPDEGPNGQKHNYEVNVVENNIPGLSIFTVKASDADSNQNARVSYILEDSTVNGVPISSYVSINADSGVINTVRSFDYEQLKDFHFRVKAQDRGSPPLSSNVTVKIIIKDQNDNAPQILYPVQTSGSAVAEIVPRSADVGYLVTKVVAVDVDSGQNAWLSYKLQKASDRALFEVGPQNGEIRTVRQVTDKDAVNQKLTVVVEDNGQLSRSAVVTINVAVTDSFPEALTEFKDFTQEMADAVILQSLLFLIFFSFRSVLGQVSYSIPEEMPEGSIVGNIAQDLGLDVKRLQSGRARIYTVDSTEYIELNKERGVLLIKEKIDREFLCAKKTPCSLHLQMILENPMELYKINVEITDMNDNTPVFQAEYMRIEISEAAATGARFILQKALDADVGTNGLQSYSLKPTDHFVLELRNNLAGVKNVQMVLQKPLNRESQEQITLLLTALDGGEPVRSGTVQIHVTVLDANDNAPVFSQSIYKATVNENAPKGTILTTVSASDADKAINGEVTYYMSSTEDAVKDNFAINNYNGEITLTGQLDYEHTSLFELDIQARDLGGLSDSCKVIINVLDINDNKPVISILSMSSSISEESPSGTVVTMMNVNDLDSGANGQIKCSINERIPFTITSPSNNIFSLFTDQELDREMITEYNITVTCSDEGVPSLSSSASLRLHISDVNDNAPVFERKNYEAYVIENNTPGLSIITVKSSDADSNQNARVSYILEDSTVNGVPISSFVTVSADSGVINAVRSFDYEQLKDFHFRVIAQDGGSPPLSSNVTVKVIIQDQNDNAPQVLYPVQTGGSPVAEIVPRSADVGYLVTKVVAVDVDSGQNAWLSYKLQKASDRALFEVGPQNGEIRTVRQVTDKDAVKQKLTIVVEDNGQPSRSAVVNINVAVADSFPETDFTHGKEYNDDLTFYLVLALAAVSFLFILTVVVIISVKIYRWRQSRTFYQSSLPVIPYYPPGYSETGTLPHMYNYNVCMTTDSRKSDCKYPTFGKQGFLIVDPNFTETMEHTINENLTDDSPDMISYSISEEMPQGSVVGNIVQDLGLDLKRLKSGKARVFSGDSTEYIELNKERGVLLTMEKIDRETLCAEITPCAIHLQMILENPMELYTITVEIADINDNAPLFQEKEIKIEISESALTGAKFMLERAIDADVGTNGLQSYSLKPTNHFYLELQNHADSSRNVEMILQKPLDRENQAQFTLLLTAIDGGEPLLSGTVQIQVTVLDANDNAPVFAQKEYKTSVLENAPKGSILTTVSASDADEGTNGQVVYYISNKDKSIKDSFVINHSNGEITLNQQFDYEKTRHFQLDIQARDQGGLWDSCKVVIDVLDMNDNKPVITILSMSSIFSEDSPSGTVVAMMKVNDPDSGANGRVHCFVGDNIPFTVTSPSKNVFSLNTEEELDREKFSEYNIIVTCSDEGVPSLYSSASLRLHISDINDNAPVFESNNYEAFLVENNTPGLSIFTVKASDVDFNQNARVSYILEDSTVNGVTVSSYVSVSADSGVIIAMRSFDYEQLKDFHFRVKAQDGGSPPLSSNVTVKVIIQDQNDNAPQVLYPVQTSGSPVAEIVPRLADVGYLVTKVVAVDVDSGQNAWLSYKLQKASDRALFEVGPQNGEIRTVRQVTDKDAVKQKLTVVVEDNGQPSRSAIVNINVAVADSFPEALSEFTDFTHGKEYNDDLTFYLVLALASVSFLFITTLVVIISVKIYRWRQSRIFYQSNLPVIPYYPPGYADTGVTGTLANLYNYDVCMTTDSRKSDCKYSTLSGKSFLVVDPSSTQETQRAYKVKNLLEDVYSPETRIFAAAEQITFRVMLQTVLFFIILSSCSVLGQVSYSIPEEMPKGSVVGNIAQDLSLDTKRLKSGRARIYTVDSTEYIQLNKERGVLLINEEIDRETLCEKKTLCALHLQMILESPMELYTVTVKITDINDNAPFFQTDEVKLKISESAVTGARFMLEKAMDADVGTNGLQSYSLKPTDHFVLKWQTQTEEDKTVEMVLQKPLDREKEEQFTLLLTAMDGGEPVLSSTVHIHVTVLDANDNAPVFTQNIYKASLLENALKGTKIAAVSASDPDEGPNGQAKYYITNTDRGLKDMFTINENNGEILLNRQIDYETVNKYQLDIQAIDHGGLSDSCKLIIDVLDINDNKPSIAILSMSGSISEESPAGTVIAMINVNDLDAGLNGQVHCIINENFPFSITSTSISFFSLITDQELDREKNAEYNITVTCSDEGDPPLSSSTSLRLHISDVNDNAPAFDRNNYEVYLVENNPPGLSIFSLKASDADSNQNAHVSYILEDSNVNGIPVSSYVSVSADSGVINAVRSLDYEQLKHFHFRVKAQDGGSPPLSSNVTVKVIIQDQNDNAPQVLYPVQTGGSPVAEIVPRSAEVGYLVTKVVAVDVDSGQNAWLSYKLQKASDRALFEVGPQNGEIRTVRQVTDKDAVKQKLTVVVEDNGQPSRSAIVNINVAVADSFPEVLSEFTDFTHSKEYNDDLTFYLVLALAAVSFLFITTLVVIISVKIYRWRQSRIFYQSNLPVIPYYPSGFADTGVTGTLPHMYNYDVCMTSDRISGGCKYSTLGGQSVLLVDPGFTETIERAKKERNMLEDCDSPDMVRVFNCIYICCI